MPAADAPPPPPFFPNLERVNYSSVDALSFENLAYHAPRLRKVEVQVVGYGYGLDGAGRALRKLCLDLDPVLPNFV